MKKYKNILVACELLATEDQAVLSKAELIAEASSAKLHLIHVVEQFYTYGMPPYPTNISEMQEDLVSTAKTKLSVVARRLSVEEAHCYTPVGSAKEEILEIAEKINADLIILGSRGERGISTLFLGSTANAVLNRAKCDVLAVRVKHNA